MKWKTRSINGTRDEHHVCGWNLKNGNKQHQEEEQFFSSNLIKKVRKIFFNNFHLMAARQQMEKRGRQAGWLEVTWQNIWRKIFLKIFPLKARRFYSRGSSFPPSSYDIAQHRVSSIAQKAKGRKEEVTFTTFDVIARLFCLLDFFFHIRRKILAVLRNWKWQNDTQRERAACIYAACLPTM